MELDQGKEEESALESGLESAEGLARAWAQLSVLRSVSVLALLLVSARAPGSESASDSEMGLESARALVLEMVQKLGQGSAAALVSTLDPK